MPAEKKLKDAVVLFASIEREHHERLRTLSFQSHCSIADLTREAIESYISEKELKTNRKSSKQEIDQRLKDQTNKKSNYRRKKAEGNITANNAV